jgi:N-acetylglutamate synthase
MNAAGDAVGDSGVATCAAEVRLIEELSMNAWPALSTRLLDGWILRFSGGYTKRANSVNPLYPASLAPEEKIGVCESLYRSEGLPVVFKLADGAADPALDGLLASRGYGILDPTRVMTLDLAGFGTDADPRVDIAWTFSGAWIEAFSALNGLQAAQETALRAMLERVAAPKAVASARVGDRIVACGFGAIERGRVGIFDIVVDRELRGRGLGKAVVASILAMARRLGAEAAYLQVLAGNAAAERLYAGLGFADAYSYHYRKSP